MSELSSFFILISLNPRGLISYMLSVLRFRLLTEAWFLSDASVDSRFLKGLKGPSSFPSEGLSYLSRPSIGLWDFEIEGDVKKLGAS